MKRSTMDEPKNGSDSIGPQAKTSTPASAPPLRLDAYPGRAVVTIGEGEGARVIELQGGSLESLAADVVSLAGRHSITSIAHAGAPDVVLRAFAAAGLEVTE